MTVALRDTEIPGATVRVPDIPPDAYIPGLKATVIEQDPLVASATVAHVVL
jgi:hypothetical protein